MVREIDDKSDEGDGRLFPDAHDRELIYQEEAAEIAGCTVPEFLAAVHSGIYPQWNGFPDLARQWVVVGTKADGSPRWAQRPRWRRGAVIAAVAKCARRRQAMRGN